MHWTGLTETGLFKQHCFTPLPVLEIGVIESWGREEMFPYWYVTNKVWRVSLSSSLPALSHGHERSGIKATEGNILTLC